MNKIIMRLAPAALLLASAITAQAEEPTTPAAIDYNGYLNITMGGDPIAVNQKSTVQITPTGDGKCDFLLPNLMLGDSPLGDISLKDVTVAESDGVTTYTKEETQMGLLEGAINAKVSLDGKISADGIATMNIPVIWLVDETSQIPISVTFTTKPTGVEYSGYLNITMGGEPIAINNKASVYIVDVTEGECMFLLPDLALDDMPLGDISLEGVKVATESDDVTTYTKEETQMGLLEGAINAKVSLDGKISANGIATMNIPVIWLVDETSQIPINVTFTTTPVGDPYAGFLAIAFADSAPMVENMGSTVYITSTGEGKCNFLLPNLSLGEGFDLGDISLSDVTVTEADGIKTYTHNGTDMTIDLMGNKINAKVTLNGTIDADGNVDMTIPVLWVIDADNSLTINVKFTSKPAGKPYNGFLAIAFAESAPMVENMDATVYISEDGYGTCNFMLPNLSLGEGMNLGNIALNGVKVTEADGVKTYTHDGTDMTIDLMGTPINAKVSLNGTIDADGNVDMTIPVLWVMDQDNSLTINVKFTTKPAGKPYNGYLSVAFEDSDPMVENMESTVYISEDGYGSCNFMLPNLSLGDELNLGNIALSGVRVTEADGVKTYTHDGTDMTIDLMGTPINAKVSLNGTIDANGDVDMTIPVLWVDANLPINVKFSTKKQAGVVAVEVETGNVVIYGIEGAVKVAGVEGIVSVYNTMGAKVAEAAVDGEAEIAAPKGIAIVATPTTTAKVVVK